MERRDSKEAEFHLQSLFLISFWFGSVPERHYVLAGINNKR